MTIGDGVAQGRIPAVAVSGTGDAFIAFEGLDGSWVQRYTKASDTLEAPTRIDAPNGNVLIAADDAGGALVIAQRHQTYVILARRFAAGAAWPGGWEAAHEIQAREGGQGTGRTIVTHSLSDLAMTGAGHAVVAWNRWDSDAAPAGGETYLSVYDAGRGWDTARRFSAGNGASDTARCTIAAAGQSLKISTTMSVYDFAGDATDVWVNDMTYDRVTGVGVVGAPRILFPLTGDQSTRSEEVAADPAGNVFAAIMQHGPYAWGSRVLVASAVGGTWSSPIPLNAESVVADLALSVGRNGDAIATWTDCPVDQCSVRARRLVGGTWGPEFDLSLTTQNRLGQSRAAVDGRGRVLAVWIEANEASAEVVVRAREVDAAGGWTAPHSIATIPSGHAIDGLYVAFGPNGTGVAVWGVTEVAPHNPRRGVQAAVFRD